VVSKQVDITSMKIAALEKYRRSNPKGYFEDLPWEIRYRARQWLYRLCSKWGRDLPAWRFAILVGQAKRLALNPPTSAWERSMLAKRGGLAVQRKYLVEGRHPTEKATQARLARAIQRLDSANRVLYLSLSN
jgi:hypothetical protein